MQDINTDELKACAPLIPYVEKHYKDKIKIEKRSEKVVFANCPWHQENTGSLALFSNGTYKCFGCGVHGDIIALVQAMENVSFSDACKIIGDNVGYEIILQPENKDHEKYKDALDNHCRRYWNNLQKDADALNYLLNERGITPTLIDKFRLGLTDADEYKFRNDIGNISNKLVFPILEHKRKLAKCVGMAYRCLDDSKPKYINDINQDGRDGQDKKLSGVFIKGNMLYGMSQSFNGIRDNKYAILVEGYFDVISLHQSGFDNAVGSMGTSLTDTQIKELSKVTNNILLFYDSDNAGISAMVKNIQILLSNDFNVQVCCMNNGKDPADLCKSLKFDKNLIQHQITLNTQQALDFAIDILSKQYQNIASIERTKALQSISPIIDSVKDKNLKKMYENKMFKKLDII